MNQPVYRLRDVEKIRTKGGVSFTLRVPELTVFKGAFVSVVGPSGCGKSTLLDLLALVLDPNSWTCFTISLAGIQGTEEHDIPRLSENEAARIRRNNIGYVLQNGGLLPFLNVFENILITAELSGRRVRSQEVHTLAGTLGLSDQLSKKPQYLSGGQRQRVAVARALIHRPAIILADEPTAAVDYPTALDIRDELKHLAHGMGAAVVMVTHDQSLVREIADWEVRFDVVRESRHLTVATTRFSKADALAATSA
ncbi:ABC transporter ATP-binding protein [Desulfobulbus alkaliphilus]|uniref:ABC transporter ATP-binding protein n=1 Tax=Desulfobulbus alkaliphilus TaxID=869814 RepID=UPI0019625502|nr:ATP-binding cassette domain-containing protein [Desulfobulbus alkaliphilus]MBM9536203.1 ATP-binding cassette domain-containing protein [Desulfobulbus alkaliphilus]